MSVITHEPGPQPELAFVEISLIDVDHNYQREIKQRLVEKILKDFSWAKFGALVLSRQADGRFSVVEGQHRLKAAQLIAAIDTVPAVIVSHVDVRGEAQSFIAINRDRMAVTSIEQYWAGVTAGDPKTLTVQKALQAAGCDVVPAQGYNKPGLTNAVGALHRAIERYGAAALRRSLMIIRAAWPNDKEALRGTLITALARLVKINGGNCDDGEVARVLRGRSFAQMTADAEGFRKLTGGSAETALVRSICEMVNKGKRVNILYYAEGAK